MSQNNSNENRADNITISKNNKELITLINTFEVDPKNQDKLLEVLQMASEKSIKYMRGFISTTFHKSMDGARVVNYAQWRNKEDFEAMLQNPEAKEHLEEALKLAQPDPHLYEVVSIHHK